MNKAMITDSAPEIVLEIPKGTPDKIYVEVAPQSGDLKRGVNVRVYAGGTGNTARPLANFSLFPPDQPGRFALRVPKGVRALRFELDSNEISADRKVEIRIVE